MKVLVIMINNLFQGTGRMLKLLSRQHRLKIILWLTGIIGLSLAVALAYPELYTTQEDIMGFALTMDNPAMRALIGGNYVIEDFNIGAVFASEMLLFSAIAVAIMNILMIKASTREDEETGRLEMIRSLPVGKISYLTASVSMMLLVNLTLTVGLTVVLATLGTNNVFTWDSSLLYSAILGLTGLFFTGVTAVFAQLASTTYGTNVFSFGALFLAYLIRVFGDVQNETISLLSPLGWVTRSEVFVNDHWLPVFVLAVSAVLLIILAFYLHARRDMFAGILPNRPGRSKASTFLKTTPGFVWYLEKGKIIGWFFLIFSLSAAFGGILGELETYFTDMDIIQLFLADSSGSNMTEQFTTLLVSIMAVFSIIPSISILHSLRGEEKANRTEHFYTRSISRNKILGTYFSLSLLTAVLMQFAISAGLYLTSSQVLDQAMSFETLLKTTFIFLPAMLLIIGLTTLFVGSLPKLTLVSWLYIVFLFITLYVGNLLEMPDWLSSLSVYYHIPEYPYETIEWGTLWILTGIGVALSVIGFIGYNKRDIEG